MHILLVATAPSLLQGQFDVALVANGWTNTKKNNVFQHRRRTRHNACILAHSPMVCLHGPEAHFPVVKCVFSGPIVMVAINYRDVCSSSSSCRICGTLLHLIKMKYRNTDIILIIHLISFWWTFCLHRWISRRQPATTHRTRQWEERKKERIWNFQWN